MPIRLSTENATHRSDPTFPRIGRAGDTSDELHDALSDAREEPSRDPLEGLANWGDRLADQNLDRIREAHAVLVKVDDLFGRRTEPPWAMGLLVRELLRLYDRRERSETFEAWATAAFAHPPREKLVPQLLAAMLLPGTPLPFFCAHYRTEPCGVAAIVSTGVQWCETAWRDLVAVHGINVLPELLKTLPGQLQADQFRGQMMAALHATHGTVTYVAPGQSYAGIFSIVTARFPEAPGASYWLVAGPELYEGMREGAEFRPFLRASTKQREASPFVGVFGPIARHGTKPFRLYCLQEALLPPNVALLGVTANTAEGSSIVGAIDRYLDAPERRDGAVLYERAIRYTIHPSRLARLEFVPPASSDKG